MTKKVHKDDQEEPRNQIGVQETIEGPSAHERPTRKSAAKLEGKLKNIKEEKYNPKDPNFEVNDEYDENDDIIEDDGNRIEHVHLNSRACR